MLVLPLEGSIRTREPLLSLSHWELGGLPSGWLKQLLCPEHRFCRHRSVLWRKGPAQSASAVTLELCPKQPFALSPVPCLLWPWGSLSGGSLRVE